MKRLLLGMVAACMATSMVAQDPATYEKAGEYTLENLWMKAATTGNNMGVADQLGGANDSRGMTVKGDEMLFAYRATFTGIKIYDLKTGEKKRDVQFDTEKFKITYTYTKIDTIVNAPGDTTFQQTPMEEQKNARIPLQRYSGRRCRKRSCIQHVHCIERRSYRRLENRHDERRAHQSNGIGQQRWSARRLSCRLFCRERRCYERCYRHVPSQQREICDSLRY